MLESAEQAAALLERVADARADYTTLHADKDVEMSVEMLRAAARIIRTGEIQGWVPYWRWHEFPNGR